MRRSRQASILAAVAVVVCLCLVCVGVFAYIKLVREPEQELAEYEARYGDIVAKTQAIVDARLQAQRDALAAARAVLLAQQGDQEAALKTCLHATARRR